MPAKSLIVEKPVKKRLLKFPAKIHIRLIDTLSTIQENPLAGTKLHGELGDYYKFRVGDYRIVYIFNPKTSVVTIVKIEHRQGVYR